MGSARNGAPRSTPTSAPLSPPAASPAAPHWPPSATFSQPPRPSEPPPNQVDRGVPADVHARFRRQTGVEVLFICGTDEHGTPTEFSAAAAGQDVRTYCKEQHAI